MSGPRFHIDASIGSLRDGDTVALPPEVAHHALRVLRLQVGDALVLFDGRGGEYEGTLVRVEGSRASVAIASHRAVEREAPHAVTLVMSVIATDAMDAAVRKAVELSAARIVPVIAERSQRLAADRLAKRHAHWRSIAIAACEQCGRNRIPPVDEPVLLERFVARFDRFERMAVAHPGATQSLAELSRRSPPDHVLIGPEGGLTDDELRRLVARGAHHVHLGAAILRADTAALAALAIVASCFDASG